MTRGVIYRGVRSLALSMLRHGPPLRRGILRAAVARRRALILCYHRVSPVAEAHAVVEPLHPDRLAAQIQTLKDIGDIVPLEWLLERRIDSRPVFALTFDDDDPGHVRYTLPVLKAMNVPATFFLSGRSLAGLGPYWWTLVQRSIEEIGLSSTCRALGYSDLTLKELVRTCRKRAFVKDVPVIDVPETMSAGDIRTLANAGMGIGFHTLRHPAMTALDDRALENAAGEGRDALSAVAGRTLTLFAYPYGAADQRVASAVRRAGYQAAFVLGDRPTTVELDRFLIPRWQPGPLAGDDLAGDAALRFHRRAA